MLHLERITQNHLEVMRRLLLVSHCAREDAPFGGSNKSAQSGRGHGVSTVTGVLLLLFKCSFSFLFS